MLTIRNGCVTPGHKILTASLEWKPIEDIKKGNLLIGFDSDTQWPTHIGRLDRISEVQNSIPIKKEVFLIEV